MSVEDKKHRSHLPMATPERTGLITYDAKDSGQQIPANFSPTPEFPEIEEAQTFLTALPKPTK